MMTWKDVNQIFKTILRWWWVVVLAVVLASGTAFYLSQYETRFFVARTSLIVGNTLGSTVPDPNQVGMSSTLARAYGELARREPILQSVVDELKLPISWSYLNEKMLQTNVVPSANLLEIYVTDSNPERAAVIANTIGEKLIAYSPSAPERLEAERLALEQQLRDSETKINDLKTRLAELQLRRDKATSASDLTEINGQIDQLNKSLEDQQGAYVQLLKLKGNSTVNSLNFFERAIPPSQPLPSRRIVAIAVAGLAGLLLALAAVYVLDRVDQRWRDGRDIKERFKMADLGIVPSGPPIVAANGDFAQRRERAMRDVHTNIMLAVADGQARSLLISSPEPSEDRTAFAVDMAYLFGRSGHRVLLVDADLQTPTLTTMLLPDGAIEPLDDGGSRNAIWAHMKPTSIPNTALLPNSMARNGSSLLVPSMRWPEMVAQLSTLADIIIFDGPSALASADAALLAPHVDGSVLVVSPAKDVREDVERSRARIQHNTAARLLGAVTIAAAQPIGSVGSLRKQLAEPSVPLLPPGRSEAPPVSMPPVAATTAETIITPPPAPEVPEEPTVEVPELPVASNGDATNGNRSTRRQRRSRVGKAFAAD